MGQGTWVEHHSEEELSEPSLFPGSLDEWWTDVNIWSEGCTVFWGGLQEQRGVEVKGLTSPSLDDLPAVAYGTTEHHTEDHPNDLLRGKQTFNKNSFPLIKKCVFHSSLQTHHDSSNADAHIPNDVELTVEEVLDACLTVLQTKNKRSQAASNCSEPWWFVRHYDSFIRQQRSFISFLPWVWSRWKILPCCLVWDQGRGLLWFHNSSAERGKKNIIWWKHRYSFCITTDPNMEILHFLLTIFWYDMINVLLLFSL